MSNQFGGLSKAELMSLLQTLQRDPRLRQPASKKTANDDLVHELQVHQIELEMQNRELRDAQQLLEESRSRYADLYDFAPVGYCTLDDRGKIEEANLTAAAMFQMQRARLIGRQLSALVTPDSRKTLGDHLKKCFDENARTVSELELRVGESAVLAVQLVSTPIGNPRGKKRFCRTVLDDISAIKDSEEALRFLASATETLSASLDRTQTSTAVDRLAVPRLADVCLLDLGERQEPRSDPNAHQAFVMRTSQPVLLPDLAADAELFDGARSAIVVPLISRGRARGTMTLLGRSPRRPYTKSDLYVAAELAKRASLAFDNADLYYGAQQAATTREDILAIVSHDLRTPLAAIMLAADLLLYSADLDEKEQRQCTLIKRSGERMTKMLTDLLDMSSIEAGRFPLDMRAHGANSLLQEAADAFRPLANDNKLVLEVALLKKDRSVHCDRDRVLQVFSNLIGNALKFTPPGGTIELGAKLVGDRAQFSVRDSGSGIPDDRIAHIFERFWQPPEHTRRGRGLGLFIAKGIVEAMNGDIGVTSVVGAGTRFFFTLSQTKDAPKISNRASLARRADGFVLVIDDDPSTRAALVQLLAISGREVNEATDGVEALKLLSSTTERPSHIVVDLEMPNMDGREFIATLRKKPAFADTDIVIVSSRRDVSQIASALGVESFFEKPVDASRLLEIVARD